jgi:hypothetical protein
MMTPEEALAEILNHGVLGDDHRSPQALLESSRPEARYLRYLQAAHPEAACLTLQRRTNRIARATPTASTQTSMPSRQGSLPKNRPPRPP